MKKLLALTTAFVLTAGPAAAQAPKSRVYTQPPLPSAEALTRLNLKQAWRTYLPTDTSRDGVATVQVMGDRLYIQLRNGAVLALNADTGQTLWRARVGQTYNVTQPLGFNFDTVFVVNGSRVFGLDRATGGLKHELVSPNIPTAPPVGDAERLYLCVGGNRLLVYTLPVPDENEGAVPAPPPARTPPAGPIVTNEMLGTRRSALGGYYGTESRMLSPLSSDNRMHETYTPLATANQTNLARSAKQQLSVAWEYTTDGRLEYAPLITLRTQDTPGFLVVPSAKGTTYGSVKSVKALTYGFETEAPATAPMAQYGDIAYMSYGNATLSAMNIDTGKLLWRLPIAGTNRRKPIVTDEDIYILPDRAGLYRINRGTGDVIWQNQKAQKFLSYNRKFVYALDFAGDLLVLDRARGTELSKYDVRDLVVAIDNEYTDRFFLAAHDGLLVSFHDRDYASPVYHKQLIEEQRLQRKRMEEMPAKE
ncbi:MAG: PQQ-binding-like beta-propeller repeat protein [Planctomycetia bacterium]|nr:PQQ-binding-like beta-propeller repeat protein [Planctomycetia bacterium]